MCCVTAWLWPRNEREMFSQQKRQKKTNEFNCAALRPPPQKKKNSQKISLEFRLAPQFLNTRNLLEEKKGACLRQSLCLIRGIYTWINIWSFLNTAAPLLLYGVTRLEKKKKLYWCAALDLHSPPLCSSPSLSFSLDFCHRSLCPSGSWETSVWTTLYSASSQNVCSLMFLSSQVCPGAFAHSTSVGSRDTSRPIKSPGEQNFEVVSAQTQRRIGRASL